jgi:hypothetical protein
MGDHGERPEGAIRRVGPGEKARLADDGMPGEGDTEGHLRSIRVGPGEHTVGPGEHTIGPGEHTIGDAGTPADPSEARDRAE